MPITKEQTRKLIQSGRFKSDGERGNGVWVIDPPLRCVAEFSSDDGQIVKGRIYPAKRWADENHRRNPNCLHFDPRANFWRDQHFFSIHKE